MQKSISLTLFLTVALFVAFTSFAQSTKYLDAMKQNVAILDTTHSAPTLQDLGNRFQRIGDAEKTQGLPYYYAAYCTVMTGLLTSDPSKGDEIADKAETFIAKAESLDKATSETWVIRSLIATVKMMVDPQNRYMQYGTASSDAIQKAKDLDPSNPRPILLEGQSKFYTPEAYGGGKTVAKPIFEKAMTMFAAFKPASDIAPRWGQHATEYFLSMCN